MEAVMNIANFLFSVSVLIMSVLLCLSLVFFCIWVFAEIVKAVKEWQNDKT